ncbi:MAG: radical SAM protein [Deltaproteobacteria bacterium]|nr:radical SAM protein [Deltaproteobacteria bacterium]
MDTREMLKQFAAVKTAKVILKVLPHISEERLLTLPLVRKGLEGISYYPEGKDFLQSILLQARRLAGKCSGNCLNKFAENLIVNEFILAAPRREEFRERYGFHPPFLLVLSPTMRCNLACYGCYAGQYAKGEELATEEIHRLLREAKEMGVFFITVSGGEPFIRPDLLDVFAAHNDLYFQVYTNGTFIDRALARRLADLGNVLPAISVEGFEKETDARRGPGHFQKILGAMANLREEGVLFGFSATATRETNDFIMSDEFVNFFAAQGCFIGWYFNYIPIGTRPTLALMPTPEQRIYRWTARGRMHRRRPVSPCQLSGRCRALRVRSLRGGQYPEETLGGDSELRVLPGDPSAPALHAELLPALSDHRSPPHSAGSGERNGSPPHPCGCRGDPGYPCR